MKFLPQSLARVRHFFIAALSVTLGSFLVLPMVSRAWTPTTPQISVAIFGGTGNDVGNSMTVDSSGNVYTTGYFTGTVDFDPGAGIQSLTATTLGDVFVSKLNSSGEYVWAKQFGGTGNEVGQSVAVDSSGNVYTSGSFAGTSDFDPGVATQDLISNGSSSDVFVSKLNSSGEYVWAKQFGGTGIDSANSVAVDSSGNVYTTGPFAGTADFDPSGSTQNLISNSFSNDVFVSKLNASGVYVWAKQFSGSAPDSAYSVAVDASGNVYTTGFFQGTVDFDPSGSTLNVASLGLGDVFVSKLDASGGFVWVKQLGGTSHDIGYSVAVDSSGNVYTTGSFQGTADFDPSGSTQDLISAGGADVFVSKLVASGVYVWAKQFSGTGQDVGRSVTVDASGNVYTTGGFSVTADFDPNGSTQNLTSLGSNDVFVSKLDSFGVYVWAKQFSGTGNDIGYSVAIDSSGNVYTTGSFADTTDFDPGAGTFSFTAGLNDAFVVKLNPSGDSIVSGAVTTTTVPATTTTTVPATTTTTVPITTTTTVPVTTTTVPVTTTTVPASTALVLRAKKVVTATAVATYAKLTIKTGSVVSLKVAKASSKFCKVSRLKLKGLKVGSCKVTVRVKPAKGKSVTKTLTLKVLK